MPHLFGLELNSVDEVIFVLIFFILDLDVKFALLEFRRRYPLWLDLLHQLFPGKNLDFIEKRFARCSKRPGITTCFCCIASKAAKQLFNPDDGNKNYVIAIGDSMATELENVVKTIVLPGARLRELVRCVSFLATCFPNTKFLIISFTCEITPFPYFKDNFSQTSTISNPEDILKELEPIVTDFKPRILLSSPFYRPSWVVSTQPHNFRSVPTAYLSKMVCQLHLRFTEFCRYHGINFLDVYNILKEDIFFRPGDIHLNYEGKTILLKAVKKFVKDNK